MNEGGRLVWAMEGIGGVTGGDQLGTEKGCEVAGWTEVDGGVDARGNARQ